MKNIAEFVEILKEMSGIDGLSIQDSGVEEDGLLKIPLAGMGRFLSVPKGLGYRKVYGVKRCLELYGRESLENGRSETDLIRYKQLIRELLEFSKTYFDGNGSDEGQYQFLNSICRYAVIKNGKLVVNHGVDPDTVRTSLLKLSAQNEFGMYVKGGEVYGVQTRYYKIILSSQTRLEEVVKTVVRLFLAFLNKSYETEQYLTELRNMNARLEEAVILRTKEIEKKNTQLEAEKSKLSLANARLRKLNRYFDSLSKIDPLTKLANRRSLAEYFEKKVSPADAAAPFSIVLGDIDFFKAINDTYGHDWGDRVLKKMGAALKKSFRPGDIVSRYGGEEFVVFQPKTGLEDSVSAVEKIRKEIEGVSFKCGKKVFHVTMSFGVCSFDRKIELAKGIRLADKALYEAKSGGRNRTSGHRITSEKTLRTERKSL